MHKVDQEVGAALSAYEHSRLRAGAPDSIHARRDAVQVALEQRISPDELKDYLIMRVSKTAPKVDDEPEAERPAKKTAKKAKAEAEAE